MRRYALAIVMGVAWLCGCATIVHGPLQDVRIESTPPGATATISPLLSERGPNFLDTTKQYTVTTPATLRLRRDNTYRVEIAKQGYKIDTTKIVPSYDWLWAPVMCGPCEAVGELPTYDLKGHPLPVRFAEAAFYEYPKGAVRAFGHALRIFSPDALMGNAYKLKGPEQRYFDNWHAFGPTDVNAKLDPIAP